MLRVYSANIETIFERSTMIFGKMSLVPSTFCAMRHRLPFELVSLLNVCIRWRTGLLGIEPFGSPILISRFPRSRRLTV